jgi:actin-related protein 5
MAPSATDPTVENVRQQPVISPPHLFNVSEAHFETYLAPQPDGYEKARSRGTSNTAIVIDNGKPSRNCSHKLTHPLPTIIC